MSSARDCDSLPVGFPEWNLEFEDFADDDFDDFLLRVVAHSSDTLSGFDLSSSTAELHPALRRLCPIVSRLCSHVPHPQELRPGEEATLTAVVREGGVPVVGRLVMFRAEVLPDSGGHAHYSARHSLTEFPRLPEDGRLGGAAIAQTGAPGHFRSGAIRTDSLEAVTDSLGVARVEFVAGFVGISVEVIAESSVDTMSVVDTSLIAIKVPGLVPLQESVTGVYYIGGTGSGGHLQRDNWYVRPSIIDELQRAADTLRSLAGGPMYPQFNDASLPWGGSINASVGSLKPIAGSTSTIDDPMAPHRSHSLGVDIDISVCYAPTPGVEPNQANRVNWVTGVGCRDQALEVRPEFEMDRDRIETVLKYLGDAQLEDGSHFHIRFWGAL